MKGVEIEIQSCDKCSSIVCCFLVLFPSKLIGKAWIYLPSVIKVAETANNFRNNVSSCMS